ncbi:molecular chaperone HtpG [Fodinicurvata fenggangensis]|uniref:molecular chaperone HtpG n=1 Tax=Fodinicurvata fenggangensis TaxID=1121830 RepID=UPI0005576CA9|nr:molecular chaperone HtpG [Fodinicurvata fenggangensis]
MSETTQETLSFQAEVSRLLDIVANALYSNREIFLRELISNASDACDKLRYAALTEPALLENDSELRVELSLDKDKGQLTIADNGIGMNREDLVENLGTIAKSGTSAFLDKLGEKRGEVDLIGQFGVGFYSAFMVAQHVSVETRRAGEGTGWHWESDGHGSFTIGESETAPPRGTRITITLKEDAQEFLEEANLRRIVQTYSDHIAFPVELKHEGDEEDERLNSAGALWLRPKSEISDEQYKEFYKHVAHALDEPWSWLHFRVEGMMEYTGLLFIPTQRPYDLFDPQRKHGVKLYVKRVFITDDCETLLPAYLRFLRGIIDSEDLPLNISREMLQHNPMIAKIKSALVKRVLGDLENKAEKEPENYTNFWETFGPVLKEGLYEDRDQSEPLLKLARFRSTRREGWVSLEEYLAGMKPGQNEIYFMTGEDLEVLKKSPQLEGFYDKDVEVLLLTDPIDEFWVPAVGSFQDTEFKSVTRAGADLDNIGKESGEEAKDDEEKPEESDADALVTFLKENLSGKVKDVRTSKRLTSSPVCLSADSGDLDLHLARMLKQHGQLNQEASRILEVNPNHPLVRKLSEKLSNGAEASEMEGMGDLLLDQARILDGDLPLDPSNFSKRLSELVQRSLG